MKYRQKLIAIAKELIFLFYIVIEF